MQQAMLPVAIVEALGLREGDEIEIEVADRRHFRVARDRRRDKAIENLRNLGWILPPGYRFSREDANKRGS